MAENMPQFAKIATLDNMIEAQVMEDILRDQDIPFRIQSFHDTAYDGIFQLQKGWGVIYAPAEYGKEIIEILESVRTDTYTP